MIKPPGKPGPSIFRAKQPKRTPMFLTFACSVLQWGRTATCGAEKRTVFQRPLVLRLLHIHTGLTGTSHNTTPSAINEGHPALVG